MRVLVVGGSGMLGSDLVPELARRGHEVVAPSSSELDITDPIKAAAVAAESYGKCEWCINCAAYTAVDKAESEPDQATLLNALAPGYLARACSMAGTRMLHISTDFVFDGLADRPYTEDMPTHSLGVYGKTKHQGEEAVMTGDAHAVIVRTAWLYGPNGNSFPRTMIRAWRAGKVLRVVADQTGTPTYTADLARVLVDCVERAVPAGIYHAAGQDIMTWRDFAEMAISAYRDEVVGSSEPIEVAPISTEDWPTPARRPSYSALSFEKLLGLGVEPMRPVPEALREFVRRLPAEV